MKREREVEGELPLPKKRKLEDKIWAQDGAFSCFDPRVSETKERQLGLVQECAEFLGEALKLKGLDASEINSLRVMKKRVDVQLKQIRRPFTIVVMGSFNTGKSTLINAMFGEKICDTGVVVCTDKVLVVAHSPSEHDIEDNDVLYKYCPSKDKLLELNVVDTPGLNALQKFKHSDITARILPNADLVLIVSCPDKLINESDAKFLKVISTWNSEVLFVLNKTDHCEPHEVATCERFIKDHARDYFEKVVVLPLSARTYYNAIQNGDEQKVKESKFEHLLHFVNELHRGRMWFLKAKGPIEKCLAALGVAENTVEKLEKLVENDRDGIDKLKKAIDQLLEVEVLSVDVQDAQVQNDDFFTENFKWGAESMQKIAGTDLCKYHFDEVAQPLLTQLISDLETYSDELVTKLNQRMRQLLKNLPHEFSSLTQKIIRTKSLDLSLADPHKHREKLISEMLELFESFRRNSPAMELNNIFSGRAVAGGFATSIFMSVFGLGVTHFGAMGLSGYALFLYRFSSIKANCRNALGDLGAEVQKLVKKHTKGVQESILTDFQFLTDPILSQLAEIEQSSIVQSNEVKILKSKFETMKSSLQEIVDNSDHPIPSIEELVEDAKNLVI